MIKGGFERFMRLEAVGLLEGQFRVVVHPPSAVPERRTRERLSQRKMLCNLPAHFAEEPKRNVGVRAVQQLQRNVSSRSRDASDLFIGKDLVRKTSCNSVPEKVRHNS